MPQHNDALTDLPNRLALEHALKPLVAAGEGVALAALDLDHFLEINAEFGPEVGDRVLRTLASLLAEAAPDNAYRITGDEFAVVMAGLSLEQAFLRMEALRARVQAATTHFYLPTQQE